MLFIRAPTREERTSLGPPEEWSNLGPSEKKLVLVADDEPTVRNFIATLLRDSGYEVIAAIDGNDALQRAKAHPGRIDLLLTDIQMPGMTGIELATQIYLDRPEMKILLISGLQSGMLVLDEGWHFLPKPFLPNMLRDKIRTVLGDQQQNIPQIKGRTDA